MPVPSEYSRATDDFYSFLVDTRDMAGLWSTHVTYTMTQGVFQVFRKRLSVKQAIEFASILPVGLRALFVSDWDVDEDKKIFQGREVMTQEVRSLRKEHNFSTDDSIGVVATTIRKYVDEKKMDSLLEKFPDGAVEFWMPHKCNYL